MKKVIIFILAIAIAFSICIASLLIYRHNYSTAISLNTLVENNASNDVTIHINSDGKLNINLATLEELMLLPGIGETIGNRSIEYRSEHGSFNHPEELLNVKGIGEVKLQGIIDKICFS